MTTEKQGCLRGLMRDPSGCDGHDCPLEIYDACVRQTSTPFNRICKNCILFNLKECPHKNKILASATFANYCPKFEGEEAIKKVEDPLLTLTADELKEITRPTTITEITDIIGITVKRDIPAKAITFLTMLTAYTEEDQGNIAFQAESAAGKSYIPIEIAELFPKEDVMIIASASPTAFFHETGSFDKETKTIHVNLERKILIFLDQPHFMLLERLRPLLSHDTKDRELHYRITDKTTKGGLRTKHVVIKGYPVVVFCSTKLTSDDQEKTRVFLLSPETNPEKIREGIKLLGKKLGDRDHFRAEVEGDKRRRWLKRRIYAIKTAGIRNVNITNIEEICKRFLDEHPYLAPRHQRDFPRLIALIKAHALLNWNHRERTENSCLKANEEDEQKAFELYHQVARPNELGLSPQFYEIYSEVIAPLLVNGAEVSRQAIITAYYNRYHRPLPDWRLRQEIIPQLNQAGLVAEKPNPEDRREKLIYTPVSLTISPNEYSERDTGVTKENSEKHTGAPITNDNEQALPSTSPRNYVENVEKTKLTPQLKVCGRCTHIHTSGCVQENPELITDQATYAESCNAHVPKAKRET